jgi:hypothetical protein
MRSDDVGIVDESTNVFTPHDDANNPIPFDKSNSLWAKLMQIAAASRSRSAIVPRSANAGGGTTLSTTTPASRCRTPSEITFQQ